MQSSPIAQHHCAKSIFDALLALQCAEKCPKECPKKVSQKKVPKKAQKIWKNVEKRALKLFQKVSQKVLKVCYFHLRSIIYKSDKKCSQGRSDRDDYVKILYANIESEARYHNFKSYPPDVVTHFNLPYDYDVS